MPPDARPLTTCWTKFATSLESDSAKPNQIPAFPSVPKVRPPHRRVALQVGGLAAQHDASRLEHERMLRGLQGHGCVLLDDDDRRAALVHAHEHVEDLARGERRQAERRLV